MKNVPWEGGQQNKQWVATTLILATSPWQQQAIPRPPYPVLPNGGFKNHKHTHAQIKKHTHNQQQKIKHTHTHTHTHTNNRQAGGGGVRLLITGNYRSLSSSLSSFSRPFFHGEASVVLAGNRMFSFVHHDVTSLCKYKNRVGVTFLSVKSFSQLPWVALSPLPSIVQGQQNNLAHML